jgi:ergothioneine biosynthesis protein EgtB
MPDASPVRWHLAHTTWFFETFALPRAGASYQPWDASFAYLFNSYYNTIGTQFPRAQRGVLSRPTVEQIWQYRREVDRRVEQALGERSGGSDAEFLRIVELGLHHEQQHQELILTDVKHMFSCNPLYPAFRSARGPAETSSAAERRWIEGRQGRQRVGAQGEHFTWDNERPAHQVWLEPHSIAGRLVTNSEYLAFMEDGGYQRPEWWLSLGWQTCVEQNWRAPLYWVQTDDGWKHFTLAGLEDLDGAEPVSHVSFFEADAYSRWAGARLPTEQEWEVMARDLPVEGNLLEGGHLRPRGATSTGTAAPDWPDQMFGDLWEWTASPYVAYPGYQPPRGALGEYNGKFMCNQYVLRGGSYGTPADHLRATYRNFFPPHARWQFTGIRLAR